MKTRDDKIKYGIDPNYGLHPDQLAKAEAEKKARAEKLKRLNAASSTFFLSPIPIKPKKKEEKK